MTVHNDCEARSANCALIDIDASRRGETDIYLFIDDEVKDDPFYDYDDGFSSGGDFFRIFATGIIISEKDKVDVVEKIDSFLSGYDIDDDFLDDESLKKEVYNGLTVILYHYRERATGYKCKCKPVRNDSPRMYPRPW